MLELSYRLVGGVPAYTLVLKDRRGPNEIVALHLGGNSRIVGIIWRASIEICLRPIRSHTQISVLNDQVVVHFACEFLLFLVVDFLLFGLLLLFLICLHHWFLLLRRRNHRLRELLDLIPFHSRLIRLTVLSEA